MALDEFQLIDKYFRPLCRDGGVALGIGDDAAVLDLPAGEQLVAAVDTLVRGVHFPDDATPHAVGYRALAVNLSDLAAMGAEPRWALLALTLPEADPDWLADFARGFADAAADLDLALVGGDTTRGPLTVSLTLLGALPAGSAVPRGGARPGDRIYVTGKPGAAAAGLELYRGGRALPAALRQAFVYPRPRVSLGPRLRGIARAMVDVSDGLAADLGHILETSRCGAILHLERLPLHPDAVAELGEEPARRLALQGGDDYELCFTVAPPQAAEAETQAAGLGIPLTWIGDIRSESGLKLQAASGAEVALDRPGWRHFGAGA